MTRTALCVVLALASATPLAAQTSAAAPVVTLGLTGGTLGVGPQIGVRDARIGARADATFLSFRHTFDSSDLAYRGRARLKSAGAMVDVFPFANGFRLSAGGRYNRNRGRVVAMPTRATSVGGMSFTPTQIGTLSGRGTVRRFAPAATLGYETRAVKGFAFGIEAGALFQGRVRISQLVSSTGMIPRDRLNAEQADLQNDVNDYRVYPIVQLSLGYRF